MPRTPITHHLTGSLAMAGVLVATLGSLGAADATNIPSTSGGSKGGASSNTTTHSWELPALTVQAGGENLREDDIVGTYGQPRWSARRHFAEVRTYVIPEGQFEFEYWLFVASPSRKDKEDAQASGSPKPKNEVKQVYEAELGLGHRLQLDLYQVYVKDGADGNNALDATKFELRYALADWGKLWGNPTAYAEWEQAASGNDAVEFKVLLCDELNERWRWATNFVWEEKTGGTRERGLEWNSAISYTVLDEKLSIGLETNFADISELRGEGGEDREHREHHKEFAAGPSLRFYPIPHAHVIIAEFVGLNQYAHQSKTVAIIGWEF
jgi:hypothetical protein